jgi:hypothetical protein
MADDIRNEDAEGIRGDYRESAPEQAHAIPLEVGNERAQALGKESHRKRIVECAAKKPGAKR